MFAHGAVARPFDAVLLFVGFQRADLSQSRGIGAAISRTCVGSIVVCSTGEKGSL